MEPRARIVEIIAKGVLGRHDFDITFAYEGRVSAIYAPNGTGKTNLLKALKYILNPDIDAFRELIEIPLRTVEIHFEDGQLITFDRLEGFEGDFKISVIPQPDSMITLNVDTESLDGRFYRRLWEDKEEYQKFKEATETLSPGADYLGDDRLLAPIQPRSAMGGRVARENEPVTVPITTYLQRVEQMFTRSTLASMSQETKNDGVYAELAQRILQDSSSVSKKTADEARKELEQNIDELIQQSEPLEKYGMISVKQLRKVSEHLSAARANDKNLPHLLTFLQPYFDSTRRQVESLDESYLMIDRFVSTINDFLQDKELEYHASSGIKLVGGYSGQEILAENLSSGERHLLTLLARSIIATQTGRTVLVDEPEISLGVDWQRNIIHGLVENTKDSNVQFIVASHSMPILASFPRDKIVTPTLDNR